MSRLGSFAHACRLLAAALLLAVLATASTPRPAAAHAATHLHLVSLKCIETEDWTGADNPYLIVNGQQVWSGRLNDGQTAGLTHLSPIPFVVYANGASDAWVSLYEDDWPDGDDLLGQVRIWADQVSAGNHTLTFYKDGAIYTLTYYVSGL